MKKVFSHKGGSGLLDPNIKEIFGKYCRMLYLRGVMNRLFHKYTMCENKIVEVDYVKVLYRKAELFKANEEWEKDKRVLLLKKRALCILDNAINDETSNSSANKHVKKNIDDAKKELKEIFAEITYLNSVYDVRSKVVDKALSHVQEVFLNGFKFVKIKGVNIDVKGISHENE